MDCVKSAKELKKIAKEEQRRFRENAYAEANKYAPEFEKIICERINVAAKDGLRTIILGPSDLKSPYIFFLRQNWLFGVYGPSELVKSVKKFRKLGYNVEIHNFIFWYIRISW